MSPPTHSTHPIALAHWHTIFQSRSPTGLSALLADDVVFYSPVVATAQVGKAITSAYLGAALQVFGNDTFKYVRQVADGNHAVLEFELMIDGIRINGVDILTWNQSNQLTEFKVMLRPLKAVNIIHQKMGEILQRMQALPKTENAAWAATAAALTLP